MVTDTDSPPSTEPLTVVTLVKYLLGSRQAILTVDSNPASIWVGFLFVLSAGFAREYDREDLLREPWHLLLPFAASLVTSGLLFLMVSRLAMIRSAGLRALHVEYRSFLGAYWMTAPLAWIYAIPVERLLSPENAVKANLYLLAIVSVWRVALIIRVIVVTYHAKVIGAMSVVMLFASSVTLVLLGIMPRQVSLMGLMAGLRLSESEHFILDATLKVQVLAAMLLPLWIMTTIFAFLARTPPWRREKPQPGAETRAGWSIWLLCAVSVAGWSAVLPATQREQALRRQVEDAIRDHRFEDAVNIMASHPRSEFPPHWVPLQHSDYLTRFKVMAALLDPLANRHDVWARPQLLDEFQRPLQVYFIGVSVLSELTDEEKIKVLETLRRLPERNEIIKGNVDGQRFGRTGFRNILEVLAGEDATVYEGSRSPHADKVRDLASTLLREFREWQKNSN
ncbi:hypothetical protein [Schlesneria sp. DSM 10557]|uniref:hypothetical protein n=2 Tax=unclassified Schlesneria TaxID=2762017 RepID=UPI0035A014FC